MADRRPSFLPDDLVAIILHDLPPRDLAVCRSVCKAWRAVVDEGGRLRSDLLPLSVGGIYIGKHVGVATPFFFAPPNSKIPSKLESFVNMDDQLVKIISMIHGCSNGLLLLDGKVVNPATRQWATVPRCPVSADVHWKGYKHLVFDPTLSPHFHVLFFHGPSSDDDGSAEWPPPTCTMLIFSSTTGRWEEKPFAREGGPAGTVAEELSARIPRHLYAVCWRGALYVHCKNDFVMRVTIPNRKYQVIKLPTRVSVVRVSASLRVGHVHLAKSKHGVYFATVYNVYSREYTYSKDFVRPDQQQLKVWLLNESDNTTDWVLKYDINLSAVIESFSPSIHKAGDVYNEDGNFEWDSDNNDDNVVLETEGKRSRGFVLLVGFHPLKEVTFLYQIGPPKRILACNLDNLKIRELGRLWLPGNSGKTFVYTPCYIGDLSQHKY